MSEEYQIVVVEKPTDEMWDVIGGGIGAYNKQKGGPENFQHLCFALHDPNQEVVGGLIGEIYWGWFYINLLFVKDELRGQGYGDKIMSLAEEEARQRGAKNAFLDTFSFQAPEFYTKRGYRVFGELNDFPPGHQRYYLTKQL